MYYVIYRNSQLIKSSKNGKADKVRDCIRRGVDVNCTDLVSLFCHVFSELRCYFVLNVISVFVMCVAFLLVFIESVVCDEFCEL